MLAETSGASVFPTYKWEMRGIAFLASPLFLQRFTLPFFNMFLSLDFVFTALIYIYQFASGRLFIQYDRLLWFLVMALAATSSLLLNFERASLTSYFLFLVLHFLLTPTRPSTPEQYKSTLQGFQFLVLILSCLAIAQFPTQFVVDAGKVIMFYGIFPDFLLHGGSYATIHPIEGSSFLKSNGIFLVEPSTLSQITALGILIEVLEFRRPRYLIVVMLGFLVAYSGTGLMTLLLFLPLAGLRHSRAGLSALLVIIFSLGLLATGMIDLSVFLLRAGEFETTGTSGYARFVAPIWLAAKYLDTASLQALLVGSGPGAANRFIDPWIAGSVSSWLKLFYEYGIIGSFIFVCFVASCLRRSRCPGVVIAALIFTDMFLLGFLTTSFLTIIAVLCTLDRADPRRGRIDEASRYGPSLVAGSAAG
jgi:hypothetical protein